MVGRALAGRLSTLGHDVVIGTRDVEQTLARTEPDWLGNVPFAQWQQTHPAVRLASFADAGAHGEVVVNATQGAVSLAALEATGAASLAGKVLLDIAMPLDLSQGMPPTLTVANSDSLAEQMQRAFPDARVVKSLNTMRTTSTSRSYASSSSPLGSRRQWRLGAAHPLVQDHARAGGVGITGETADSPVHATIGRDNVSRRPTTARHHRI